MSIGDARVPILTIQLQAAKQTLMQCLNEQHDDLQRMIEASFKNAVSHIAAQLDVQVQRVLNDVIRESLDEAAVQASEALAEELALVMGDAVRDTVRKHLGRAPEPQP